MDQQIPMPAAVRNHLETGMLGRQIGDLTIKGVLGGGNTAITYEAEDRYGVPWALKLVTQESYGDRAPFREVARFAQTRDERFLVFPKEIGDWLCKYRQRQVEFIWFKSRCVRGQTLAKFLASGTLFSAKTEIRLYIEHLAAALEELARMGFSHGDLHDRNIMREVVGEGGPLPEIKYVIIDFSEAHPMFEAQQGLGKDLESFGRHLRTFADSLYRRDHTSREDEKVLRAIEHIPGLLNGVTAESIGIRTPADVLRRFVDALRSAEEAPKRLRTPFDSLSAENITNDKLLAELCFTKSRWVAELEKPGNVLLVGPRGCGKSMMFRRLRLKTKIAAGKVPEIKRDPYVGFYLPCESLFFNRFSDLTEGIVERNRDALILFFNMAVTAEVFSTLADVPAFLGPIRPGTVELFRRLLRDEIGDLWDELRFPTSVATMSDLADYADAVMRRVRKGIAYGEHIPARGSTDYVTTLVDAIRRDVPSLSVRLFLFFLDDYTEERVPMPLQHILHPIIAQRSGSSSFKISAHMFGSMYSYPQPLALDEGRNILVINLGSEYLNRDRQRAEGSALIRIMNERFKRCDDYKGTIEAWLGRTSFPGGRSLSRALHDKDTRKKVKYHGIDCLLDLCTGDISEMIRMVGEIFREGRVAAGSPPREIDSSAQDRAIKSVSRDFLSRVRHIRPDGQKLYDVLYAFGELSQQLLYEREAVGQGKDSRGQPRRDPYDLLTIYVDDLTKAAPVARRVWERLQRASIFVDIKLAPSQRSVIADRVTLRRLYCPAFGTSLSSSEHLQATKAQFEYFMDDPKEFCRHYLQRVTGRTEQPALWGDASAPEAVSPHVPVRIDLPIEKDRYDYGPCALATYRDIVHTLPELRRLDSEILSEARYDIYIGAMGFEERTTEGVSALVRQRIRVERAFLLEFDMYYEATAKQRDKYEELVTQLAGGRAYHPLNAPVGNPDPTFPERIKRALAAGIGAGKPRIVFDCTSCPAMILSKLLRVLVDYPCDLTVLYAEAARYYPTREEWESGKLRPRGALVEGPFSGVRFVEKPPSLQADDTGEQPVLLVLFPTFNTERTSGVLAELDPAKRIWLIGEPHDLSANSYRIEMAQSFAAPIMYPGDPWSIVTTFDYRPSMITLAGIYGVHRFQYRIVVMPHGSKMQTLGTNLFALTHEVSMVFATPKMYTPDRYSEGCLEVWAIPLGETRVLVEKLRSGRTVANGGR